MHDFRADPSESPEGKGIARRAWDASSKRLTGATDFALEPMTKAFARKYMEDTLGFWVLWHAFGGFEGLERLGMHRATIWRKVRKFRSLNGGIHPDEFQLPGITIDHDAFFAKFADLLNNRG